jgi:hypothetical protein
MQSWVPEAEELEAVVLVVEAEWVLLRRSSVRRHTRCVRVVAKRSTIVS